MRTVPADDPLAIILAYHAQTCDIGSRRCGDCRLVDDSHALGAITIARLDRGMVADWISAHRGACVYCGDFATTRDHLVPRSWTGNEARRFVPVVPACGDCNFSINDAPVFTIAGRAELVAGRLQRRHHKQLAIPDRTNVQIAEFTGVMRVNIVAAQSRRQQIRRRLMVLDAGGAPFVPACFVIAW